LAISWYVITFFIFFNWRRMAAQPLEMVPAGT